jgi:S1-C subfamily serine protease
MPANTRKRNYTTFAVSTLASAVLIAGSMALPGYSAQTGSATAAPSIPGEGFADLIEHVQPSVVTIEIEKAAAPQLSGFSGDPRAQEFFERFFGPFGQMQPQQPRQPVMGAGSGFIIDSDGYIVTNNHVIEGAEMVTVRLHDDREFEADVIGYDEKTDLALLKIDATTSSTPRLATRTRHAWETGLSRSAIPSVSAARRLSESSRLAAATFGPGLMMITCR